MKSDVGKNRKEIKKATFWQKVRESPIDYCSDLFIVAMVLYWMVDNLWETVIATVVTVSSIILSYKVGENLVDTSMWSSIGTNVTAPLTAGGAIWMVKNGVQHALFNRKGAEAKPDFPAVNADGQDDGAETLIEQEVSQNEECERELEAEIVQP